jgi:hypothetical protein
MDMVPFPVCISPLFPKTGKVAARLTSKIEPTLLNWNMMYTAKKDVCGLIGCMISGGLPEFV